MRTEVNQVIVRPLITEKSTRLQETQRTYAFEVALGANKIQVREAVQRLFGVKVSSVRTLVVRGKEKRFGRFTGKRPNWKKAYVTLSEGEKIDLLGTGEG